MKQIDVMLNTLQMFKLTNPAPPYDSLCAEEITLQKVIDSLELLKLPTPTGTELFGMKIYVDEDCPKDKVRFKIKGVTVAEVYAFDPEEKESVR